MTSINYSIIIPHRNSFKLLVFLLKSIPKRMDFQIIIIDDNSDELVKNNLKKYLFESNVEVVFNSTSGGAGKCRNLGLELAVGKWVVFADADDYFTDNMEVLLDKYIDSLFDVVYFGTYSIFLDTRKESFRHKRYVMLVEDYLSSNDKENDLRYFFTPPWGKLIRRECIENNNIKFEEILASNDIGFSIRLGYFSGSISATTETLYNITVSHGTLTNTFIKEYFDAKLNAALRANVYLRSINKGHYQQSVLYFIAKSYKFGVGYVASVIWKLIIYRSNIFIGLKKILVLGKVLNEREQSKYMRIK